MYPSAVKTIADQLDAAGLTWRDYNQSMGADPTRETGECAHPGINQQDDTQSATATDQYATRHNPFVYFHSIIDDTSLCDSHVVNLNLLPQDLSNAASTPNYVFITPDLCADGHDATCKDPKRPGGYAGIEQFLQQWVPKITSSPAFTQQNGLLAIIFDEAATSDTSSCCGEIAGTQQPRARASPGPAVATPGRSCCRRASSRGPSRISPTTTTRCCAASRTCSGSPTSDTPVCRASPRSDPTSSTGRAPPTSNRRLRGSGRRWPDRGPPRRSGLRWSASGAAAKSFKVQVRQTKPHLRGYRTLVTSGRAGSRLFVGSPGAAYQFRVRATGVSGGVSGWATTRSLQLPRRHGRR